MMRPLLALAAAVALHVAWVASSFSPADLLRGEPIATIDYRVHYAEAVNAGEHLRRVGSLWGWDPHWMAGFPEGIIGLVDNKLFMLLLPLAPGAEATVFNALIVATLLLPVAAIGLAAWICGASVPEIAAAAFGATIATFTVPISVQFWGLGGISFFLATVLAVPAVAAIARALGEGSLASRWGVAGGAIAVVAVVVHVGAGFVLAPGLGVAALRREWRSLRRWAPVALLALALGLAAAPPIVALVALRDQLTSEIAEKLMQGGPRRFVEDWGLHLFRTSPGVNGGVGGLLALVLLAACGTRGETYWKRFAPEIGISIATFFALAYAGSLTGIGGMLTPYRFVVSAAFFLCLPAATGLLWLVRGVGGLRPAAIVVAPLVALSVAEATHALLPATVVGTGSDPAEGAIADYLEANTTAADRVLFDLAGRREPAYPGSSREIVVGRFVLLPLRVPREFLGYGYASTITQHGYATFTNGKLFDRGLGTLTEDELRAVLDRYALTWALAWSKPGLEALRAFPAVFEEKATFEDAVVFRVKDAKGVRVLEGEGRVTADFDRLEVRDARGERLVLAYHWLPTLRARPPVTIEEAPQPGAPVGFIAVHPNGVRDFSIVQRGGEN